MKLTLSHTLVLSIGTPARAVQHLLLTALATPQQKIEHWSIEAPGFAEAATFRDGYGNRAHLLSQVKPEMPITIAVTGSVETFDKAGVIGRLEYDPMPALFRRQTELTKFGARLAEGLDAAAGRIPLLHELMERASTLPQRQAQGADAAGLAHGFIGAARSLDVPARYVTGYLLDDDGMAKFHGWAEAWDDSLGWVGFDPLLNLCPAENHIRLASGLDALATMPVRSVPGWPTMPVETVEIAAQEPST